ncbi:MAG: metal ABC transporter ATP-binding protein [Christensenellales bacterium]|jgi:zinc transport system ATP-binding protein
MALVSIKNATLGYEGKAVIRDVSFSICEGDYLCIVGENGSGKSTLMKAMLGLLFPIKGSIEFGEGLRQKEIGYLPQQTETQKDFPASVREIVLSGCLNRCGLRPFYNRNEKARARANMERLGISGLSRRCHRELSGGQQQRVLLARALCATQKILLLDEPAAGLDPKASEDMYRIIEDLNRDSGITIVMISHDITTAMQYASHILHLGNTLLFYGRKEDYASTEMGKVQSALKGGDAR